MADEKVTCKVMDGDELVAEASVESNSQVVSRNGAVMKVISDDDIDWDDGNEFMLECDR